MVAGEYKETLKKGDKKASGSSLPSSDHLIGHPSRRLEEESVTTKPWKDGFRLSSEKGNSHGSRKFSLTLKHIPKKPN